MGGSGSQGGRTEIRPRGGAPSPLRRLAASGWSWLLQRRLREAREAFGFAALAEREELGREIRPGQEAISPPRTAPCEIPASRSDAGRRTGLSHPHRPWA